MSRWRWTAASSIGTAVVAASLASIGVLWGVSWTGAEDAVATAMADHLVAEAALVGEHLREVPVEVLVSLGAGHASAAVAVQIDRVVAASGLHDAALIGPDEIVLGSGGTWLPLAADRDLVAQASDPGGRGVAGPLYRDAQDDLYLSAYAPLPGRPGWVVAVEGGATLGAADRLRRVQAVASVAVLAVVALVAAIVARRVAAPLRALEHDLQHVRPGDPPDVLSPAGPREVWQVALAAQRLLVAIRDRDAAVERAHREQVEQVTRLAAEVAHEIRNPLNAMSLSIDRLARLEEPTRRRELADRLRAQVDELEAIIGRLVDVTRPLEPQAEDVEPARVVADLADESTAIVTYDGSAAPIRTDRAMLREILRNLVLNAAQAGATRVSIRQVGSPWALLVEDDGPGIADADHLFDWFHTTRARGSGLGLPTSRRMAQALGGTLVLVRSRPATFRLELPQP